MTMTTFVAIAAIYGAVLSSLVALWNYLHGRRDRGIVRIWARIGVVSDYGPAKALIVTVANIGRRPITLTQWHGLLKKGNPREFTFDGLSPPGRLEESEKHSGFTHDLSILTNNLAALYVFDTANKPWKVSKKILRRLIKDAHPAAQIRPRAFHIGHPK